MHLRLAIQIFFYISIACGPIGTSYVEPFQTHPEVFTILLRKLAHTGIARKCIYTNATYPADYIVS